jgi:hypothetical protein
MARLTYMTQMQHRYCDDASWKESDEKVTVKERNHWVDLLSPTYMITVPRLYALQADIKTITGADFPVMKGGQSKLGFLRMLAKQLVHRRQLCAVRAIYNTHV